MIKLNKEAFESLQTKYNMNDTELSRAMNIDRSTIWRVKTGKNEPGTEFISGALRAFPGAKFDDLFILPDVMRACTTSTGTEG